MAEGHLLRRRELQQMIRAAYNIEHKAPQEVLVKSMVAEGHLLRRQDLQQMTRVASNIERKAHKKW